MGDHVSEAARYLWSGKMAPTPPGMNPAVGVMACSTCHALVPAAMIEDHAAWHDRIAAVAIETTARLDALYSGCTKTVNE